MTTVTAWSMKKNGADNLDGDGHITMMRVRDKKRPLQAGTPTFPCCSYP